MTVIFGAIHHFKIFYMISVQEEVVRVCSFMDSWSHQIVGFLVDLVPVVKV
jgi:hypothetical protein